MMEPLFSHLNHWHWWIFAVTLLVLEMLTPGTFFMWMGISAIAVGLLTLLIPMEWETQFFLFAVFSVVTIAAGRVYIKRRPIETDRPTLNRRGAQYVGRTFKLSEPIIDGYGKIRVDDSTWKIEGTDTPAGAHIKVIGVEGVVLKVERI